MASLATHASPLGSVISERPVAPYYSKVAFKSICVGAKNPESERFPHGQVSVRIIGEVLLALPLKWFALEGRVAPAFQLPCRFSDSVSP